MFRKTFTFEGKRYSVNGKTQEELYERVARKKMELEQGYNRICKNTPVSKWAEEWLDIYKAPSVSSTWYKNIKHIVDRIILPEIGNLQLKDVKPIHLQRILNKYSSYSKSYIRKIYNIICEMFKIAKQNNLLRENPAENLSMPKGRKKDKRRSITPKERKYILQTADKHRAGLFIKIMLYCGLRPGEVAALQWRNIDFKRMSLTVDSALKGDGTIGEPKSDAGYRTIPIPEALYSELITVKGNPFDYVCTNAGGGRLTNSSIKQMWKSFVYNLNIEMGCKTYKGGLVPPYPVADDLVMYCLRHTYCTDLQAAGVPINVARELMGHSDISVTAEIYTHSSEESFSQAANAINELINKRNCSSI